MFCCSVSKIEKYDLEECYAITFCVKLWEVATGIIIYHVLKYFGGDRVRTFIRQDRRLRIRLIDYELNINELRSTKLLHKTVTSEQHVQKWFQEIRMTITKGSDRVSEEMLEQLETEPDFRTRVKTGEES
jgi:hypothetical protein